MRNMMKTYQKRNDKNGYIPVLCCFGLSKAYSSVFPVIQELGDKGQDFLSRIAKAGLRYPLIIPEIKELYLAAYREEQEREKKTVLINKTVWYARVLHGFYQNNNNWRENNSPSGKNPVSLYKSRISGGFTYT